MNNIGHMSKHTKWRRPAALWMLLLGLETATAADLSFIELPPGFSVELYADDLADARSMTLATDGTLFVGSRRDGRVHALHDTDGDGRADRRWLLAQGLGMPNGVVFHQGDLYVAEHGSWNRSEKAGYRVSLLRLSGRLRVLCQGLVGREAGAWPSRGPAAAPGRLPSDIG